VETGSWWSRTVRLLTPGTPVPASAAVPGLRYYVDGWPLQLYSTESLSGNRVRLRFGHGVYSDVSLTVDSDAGIQQAVPMVVVEAAASFTVDAVDADTGEPVPSAVSLPTSVAADGTSVLVQLDPTETAALAVLEGSYSWDLYARTVEWDWQRIVEGTMVIVRGDTL
jgi:hypothetical protein